jgi:outer membrane protein assembly factor BamB
MIKRLALTAASTLLLTACAGFFDKDNTPTPTPLTPFTAEIKPTLLWSAKVGSGSNDTYLKLSPSLSGDAIYTSSANGVVTATNKHNGNTFWSVNTKTPITSGTGVGSGMVVVGSRQGDVISLQQSDGRLLWKTNVSGEVLAKPAIGNNTIVVKTIDGTIHTLAASDGHLLWTYQQTEPSLILRGSSAPLVRDNIIFAGFANGNLAKIGLRNGQLDWSRPIAIAVGGFSIERMIDIDADPFVYGHRVFAATYQGKIASLDWNSGNTLWSHDISSYTGMTADDDSIYISDASGYIWAFGANNGLVNWRQTQLEARNVSPPAVMGNYVVVGDAEGYLHWLGKRDGHFAGREFAGNTIMAAPIVENNVLYALTSNGSLVAYTLSS